MSVIGRKPFVNYILDELNKSQITTLNSLLNNLGTPTHITYKDINNSLKGVHYVVFNLNELQNQNTAGILVYLDSSHCGFFVFNESQSQMSAYKIDIAKQTFTQIYESLTTEEFRQVAGDKTGEIDIDGVAGLVFTNVSASSWVEDSTYSDYGYKCALTCTGITANSVVDVIFGVVEATSNNYAPVCSSGANTVTIYSKVNDSITIPVIKEIL